MRTLDYKKVPEQIAWILACIAVGYLHPIYSLELKEKRRGSTTRLLSCVSFTFPGWRTKNVAHPNVIPGDRAREIECLLR